jgi:hypothetical protein
LFSFTTLSNFHLIILSSSYNKTPSFLKMKSTIIASLFVASALAAPASDNRGRQAGCPSVDQTATAIRDWNTDVINVNSFLNNPANTGSNAASLASTALTFASNEPHQLSVLSTPGCFDNPDYVRAVNDLKNVFGNVITGLNNIIAGQSPASNIASINHVRCCNVLPDLDILWVQSAAGDGLVGSVPTSAPRPAACSTISC